MFFDTIRYFFETNVLGSVFLFGFLLLVIFIVFAFESSLPIEILFLFILPFVMLLSAAGFLASWYMYVCLMIFALVYGKMFIDGVLS